jgi:ATP-dependent helicase/nuclease subunit B
MMQAILGPFHPHLESALVEEILRYKQIDRLSPLLVLVPSDSLRRRLKILLTRERGLSLLNLRLLTFHQLSLTLFAELNGMNPPILRDDLFLEEVLRQIIRTRQPGTQPFAGIEARAGGCAALWQTLRDLRDSLVDPALGLEALGEGHFAKQTSHRTSDLLRLLQTVLRFCAEKNIKDHSDLDRAATVQAPQSDFIKQFRQIFYYGFYDLTQIQVDFFHAVAQHYPTTLFFPLLANRPPHDGWIFAERFYQRYVQGHGGAEATRNLVDESPRRKGLPLTFRLFDQEPQRPYQSLAKFWRCQILNTFGIHDEVSAAAKEILRLAGEEKMAFDEIGVIARSLEGYGATIKEVFVQHAIPIACAIEEPLAQFPLTKAAILLLNLPAKDYPRSHVIDLLSSPYFQRSACSSETSDLRPDLWDLATRELAICKGMGEWERLERYSAKDLVLSEVSHDDEPRVIRIPAAQMRALKSILDAVVSDLNRLPPEASWTHYAAAWKALLKKYLAVATEPAANHDRADARVRDKIIQTLDQIEGLDAVEPNVSLRDFSQTFEHWLERGTVATDQKVQGVAVLNATAARGLKFRALFMVGMNEGVFPRTIREDAFLRDRDREVLERDLGYKISQKLAAFDEEKLLFSLLVNSACERLYCSFQRADESGRVLAPSWYLDELKRALGDKSQKQLTEKTIPRSLTDKTCCEPFDHEKLLLPEELAIRLILSGQESKTLIAAASLSPELFEQGLKNIERIDASTERLGMFDGMIPSPEEHWRRFSQHGLSPTALELYGRCPFQYFARRVLGLERLETPEKVTGPSLAQFGELGHLILKLTYQELIRRGYFNGKGSSTDVDIALARSAQQAFADYEANHPIGFALMWETLRETLTRLIRQVMDDDLKELANSGYVPVALETDIADRLPASWPEPLDGLQIRGRMDRIDVDPQGSRMRIVDYKFKFGGTPSAEDTNLERSALRGERLQPPFYSLLGRAWTEREKPAGAGVEASFFYIASRWSDGPLVIKSFSAEQLSGRIGDEIKKTISELAKGIQSGRFFMQRGNHCSHCDVAEICRKNHPPSLWRAENDPITEAHRQLREKDPKKL